MTGQLTGLMSVCVTTHKNSVMIIKSSAGYSRKEKRACEFFFKAMN